MSVHIEHFCIRKPMFSGTMRIRPTPHSFFSLFLSVPHSSSSLLRFCCVTCLFFSFHNHYYPVCFAVLLAFFFFARHFSVTASQKSRLSPPHVSRLLRLFPVFLLPFSFVFLFLFLPALFFLISLHQLSLSFLHVHTVIQ